MSRYGNQSDLEQQFKDFQQDFFRNLRRLLPILLIILIVIFVLTGFYTVGPDEEAVVIRFGRYVNTTDPGLHFKLPMGIDRVVKVKTKRVLQEEFGLRTDDTSGRRTQYSSAAYAEESLMLTGDLNVAEVEWVVQYQIGDPFKYLFHASEPIQNVRDVSESIMRRVVGDRLVTDVLTTGRVEIEDQAKILMQKVLDKYDIGIKINTVKLQDVNPPERVRPSFNEVNKAKQEQEKLINQAEEAYNKVIPKARGSAEKLLSESEGHAQAMVNRALGDAEKFDMVLSEYKKAPAITRRRLYLETMENLFGRLENVTVIDDKIKGVLPVFGAENFKDITKQKENNQ